MIRTYFESLIETFPALSRVIHKEFQVIDTNITPNDLECMKQTFHERANHDEGTCVWLSLIERPSSLKAVKDTVLEPSLAFADGRKIPRIVHVTSMSRCNHPIIADNLETWKLKNHSFFLHDDEAMEKLIYKDWPEFPQLQHILKCLPGRGVVWADVWRILVLWEYGGIYADIDTSPVAEFFNETTLSPRYDAFFVVKVK